MLAIQNRNPNDSCILNVLPCRIDHTGPTEVTKRFWAPQIENNGTKITHFRGRRLKGRVIRLPANYRGSVLKTTERSLIQPTKPIRNVVEDEDVDVEEIEEPPEPVQIAEQVSTFEEMIVWGHDMLPESDDRFVKGIEEWISFAEAIHAPPSQAVSSEDTKDTAR